MPLLPQHLLALVNARHGTTFELVGRYSTGEQGAFAVVDHVGRRGVLKREPAARSVGRLREIVALTTRLRDIGYPAPRYLVVGDIPDTSDCYSIQEALPGAPLSTMRADLIPDLLALNLLQRGRGDRNSGEWPGRVVAPVLHGGDGYCLLDPLRAYSAATAELLDELQVRVFAHTDDPFETGDIVHFDFNPSNILVDDHAGRVSGVIDWQDPCSGDRAFDLVTLFYYSYDTPSVRDALCQRVVAGVGRGVLGVYLAHMILRQMDWSIRFYDHATVDRWLRISRAALRDVIVVS